MIDFYILLKKWFKTDHDENRRLPDQFSIETFLLIIINIANLCSRSLLGWIAVKTEQMRRRTFANSLEGVQNDVRLFKVYMTREKPPKCQEKVNIEANFFEIEMKLKELRQNPFVPPEGQRLPDIDQVTML